MGDDTQDLLCLGIDAETGRPLPDVTEEALSALESDLIKHDPERSILEGRADPSGQSFAVVAAIDDANDLAQTGWGVIFSQDCDPAVREALQPLLDRRRGQAGDLFKIFEGPTAPGPQEPATHWIGRNGATLDVVDPYLGIPYYLLLVGSPKSIPFEFQYTLDIFWAVGRVHFPTPKEYARYAQSVVAYETAATVATRREVALFATRHDFGEPDATQLFADMVAKTLVDTSNPYGAIGARRQFALREHIGSNATKNTLGRILTGEEDGGLPALLFSGTHGMELGWSDARQPEVQGALVCQDWDGYGAIDKNVWFAGSDIPVEADLSGLIHFCFACYSGGCPRDDNFARTKSAVRQIAKDPMIARLPQAMLSHPGGGALASLGHIDRAWAYSFTSERNTGQVQGMRDVLEGIMKGDRIGQATDKFNTRWAALSVDLSEAGKDRNYGAEVSNADLKRRWIARDDARNYTILGDPAVQLRLDAMPPADG